MNEKELRFEAAKNREEAAALLDQADAAKDASEAKELNSRARKFMEDATSLDERADMRAALEEARQRREAEALAARKRQPASGVGGSTKGEESMERVPSTRELQHRNDLNRRVHLRGPRSMPESDAREAMRRWPVERLFQKVLRGLKLNKEMLTSEERAEWSEYQDRATRAIADSQSTAGGAGGELVPEMLANEIFAEMAYTGPMTLNNIRTFNQQTTGVLNFPTITNNEDKVAEDVAEGADADYMEVTTGEVRLVPTKRMVLVAITEELMMADNVSFESWLAAEVGTWLGRKQNNDFTNGTGGDTQPLGIAAVAVGRNSEVDTASKIVESDIMSLYKKIDFSYLGRPSTMLQCHSDILFDLMQLRHAQGGQRIFPLTTDRSGLMMPMGTPLRANNALSKNATGPTAKPMILADLSRYVAVQAGGLRVARDYVVRSGQTELAWRLWYDGAPVVQNAFAVLQGK